MVSLADIQINRGFEAESAPDEDLSYLSMESLFTPPGAGRDERRMQVRAYNHWLAMVEEGELPAVEELRPEEITDFGPNGVLVDLTLGVERPAIVYLGDRLAEECGDDREIFALGDVPERSLLSRLTEHCFEVVATRSPVGFDAEFEGQAGTTIYYRSILLPFSSNGSTVDFVFGVISWKEGISAATSPAPLPSPPAQAAVAAAEGLAALLAAARDTARQSQASEVRSRDALYHAISVTYDLVLAAESNPAGLARLAPGAAEADLARTIARLVFGSLCDKTRLSEIVTLLAQAQRQGRGRGELHAHLASAPGGIKALVAAERQVRRAAQVPAGSRALTHSLAARLRRNVTLAIDSAVLDGHEFGLIVARRNPDGSLALIGDAGGEVRLLERAARRLVAG